MSNSLYKTDGPVDNTRAKASRNVRQLSVMESSAENPNENEGQMAHGTGASWTSFPLPRLDDVWDAIGEAKACYFTVLDVFRILAVTSPS